MCVTRLGIQFIHENHMHLTAIIQIWSALTDWFFLFFFCRLGYHWLSPMGIDTFGIRINNIKKLTRFYTNQPNWKKNPETFNVIGSGSAEATSLGHASHMPWAAISAVSLSSTTESFWPHLLSSIARSWLRYQTWNLSTLKPWILRTSSLD